MQAFIMSIVCIVTLAGVLGYVFFSKTKTEKHSVFLNPDVTWSGADSKEVYQSLRKSNIKPIFKGEHKK